MKKAISIVLLYFILLVYLYSLVFPFIPISAKIILELVSILFCIFTCSRKSLKKEYKALFGPLAAMIVWDVITCLLNGGTEFYLAEKAITAIICFYTSHVIFLISKNITNEYDNYLLMILITVLIESTIALVMKVYPPFYSLMNNIVVFDFFGFEMEDIYDIGRFTGLGNAKFFGVLPTCALGLMTAMYLFAIEKNIVKKTLIALSFILILVVSFFTARYSMFLGAVALAYYIVLQKKHIFKNILLALIFFVVLYGVYLFTLSSGNDYLISWAFGTFDGSSNDRTAEVVIDWWKNTSFEFSTFIFGDAHYKGLNGDGYYGGVDVGIFRQIYYGGIIGLILNFVAHAKILKLTYYQHQTKEHKLLLFSLLLCYLVILTKGDTNMLSFFVLYLVYSTKGIYNYD